MFSGSTNKTLMNVFVLALLINGFIVFAEYLAVASIGTDFLLSIAVYAFLPLLVSFLAIPIALILLFWHRYSKIGLKTLLGCILYLVVGIAGIRLSADIRHNGFVSLAQRSRPLVSAINQYESNTEDRPKV